MSEQPEGNMALEAAFAKIEELRETLRDKALELVNKDSNLRAADEALTNAQVLVQQLVKERDNAQSDTENWARRYTSETSRLRAKLTKNSQRITQIMHNLELYSFGNWWFRLWNAGKFIKTLSNLFDGWLAQDTAESGPDSGGTASSSNLRAN